MWAAAFPSICLGCDVLLRHDRPLALCTRCRPRQARLPDALAEHRDTWAPWSYDGPLARAVVALKFAGAMALAGPIGRLLAEEDRLVRDREGAPIDLVIPVPLHWRRRLVRGFDQSEELARFALRELARRGAPAPALGQRVLVRRHPTRPQTELDAAAREANVAGAFAVRRPERVRGRRILVLDDVTTTGATAQACVRALTGAGAASVGALALLRAL